MEGILHGYFSKRIRLIRLEDPSALLLEQLLFSNVVVKPRIQPKSKIDISHKTAYAHGTLPPLFQILTYIVRIWQIKDID